MSVQGSVVSARALDDATMARIESRLAALLGEPVTLTQSVDKSLLAGIVVYVGGRRFDGSVKGFLEARERGDASAPDTILADNRIDTRQIGRELQAQIARLSTAPGGRPVGRVLTVGDGIALVDGLKGCRSGELLDFEGGVTGIAFNLYPDHVGAVLLSGTEDLHVGSLCVGTGRIVEVPVGEALLGRVVDPLGRPLDEAGPVKTNEYRPVESPAAAILERSPVNRPLQTGILAIDAVVPIGRGQRELIIGDRQTGKTAIAVDTILNQRDKDVLCVYVAIGQKASTVTGLLQTLRERGAMSYTTVVYAGAADSAPLQYIAPYAGCAIAEHFMRAGRDVLIIYDDLTKHAQAYRSISLLLRRPPGREAYPGDIFYLHSRLLERAAQLGPALGGGSMTALPIIETMAGDISAYIPTNVISITDGQIFLSADLFRSGVRPAVNVGLSVSRVGGAAQVRAMRAIGGQLRLELAQYRELAVFAQFGSDLDYATRAILEHGERLTEILKQEQYAPYSVAQQVILLYAVTKKMLQEIPKEDLEAFKKNFLRFISEHHPHLITLLSQNQPVDDTVLGVLAEAVREFTAQSSAK